MAVSDEVRIRILTDVAKAGKDLAALGITIGGVVLAIKQVVKYLAESEQAFFVQEQAEAKLNAVLKSTGGAAGYTAGELKNMASEMQRVTVFGDETTMAAQAVMATFVKIGRDVFPQAVEAAANMSTVLGQDLQASVIQVGKALNDPIIGVTALRRVGVQLTEQQQESVKTFMAQGDILSAQGVILRELNTQFGGAAKAMGETAYGAAEKLKNAYGDLREAQGEAVAVGMKPFREWLTKIIEGLTESQTQANALAEVIRKGFADSTTPLEKLNLALAEVEERGVELMKQYRQGSRYVTKGDIEALESQRVLLIQQIRNVERVMALENQRAPAVAAEREAAERSAKLIADLMEGWEKTTSGQVAKLTELVALYSSPVFDQNSKTVQAVRDMYIEQLAALKGQKEETAGILEDYTGILDAASTKTGLIGALGQAGPAAIEGQGRFRDLVVKTAEAEEVFKTEAEYAAESLKEQAEALKAQEASLSITAKRYAAMHDSAVKNAAAVNDIAAAWGGVDVALKVAIGGDVFGLVKSMAAALGPEGELVGVVVSALEAMFDRAFGYLDLGELDSLKDIFADAIMSEDWTNVQDAITEQLKKAIIGAIVASEAVAPYIEEIKGWMRRYLLFGTDYAKEGLMEAIRRAMEAAEGAGALAQDIFDELGLSEDVTLARGGIVTQPTHALIGEAGPEAVIPLDRAGSLGTTVIVYGSVISERDLDSRVAQALGRKGRGF